MERLTYRDSKGKAWAELDAFADAEMQMKFGRVALNRLTSYEDTGLMPDEIPHWIPCGEKMPEDVYGKVRKQITVLVYTTSKNVKPCSRVREYKWDKETQRYEETENFTWNKCKNPTFWMPYPQPPKGESK